MDCCHRHTDAEGYQSTRSPWQPSLAATRATRHPPPAEQVHAGAGAGSPGLMARAIGGTLQRGLAGGQCASVTQGTQTGRLGLPLSAPQRRPAGQLAVLMLRGGRREEKTTTGSSFGSVQSGVVCERGPHLNGPIRSRGSCRHSGPSRRSGRCGPNMLGSPRKQYTPKRDSPKGQRFYLPASKLKRALQPPSAARGLPQGKQQEPQSRPALSAQPAQHTQHSGTAPRRVRQQQTRHAQHS